MVLQNSPPFRMVDPKEISDFHSQDFVSKYTRLLRSRKEVLISQRPSSGQLEGLQSALAVTVTIEPTGTSFMMTKGNPPKSSEDHSDLLVQLNVADSLKFTASDRNSKRSACISSILNDSEFNRDLKRASDIVTKSLEEHLFVDRFHVRLPARSMSRIEQTVLSQVLADRLTNAGYDATTNLVVFDEFREIRVIVKNGWPNISALMSNGVRTVIVDEIGKDKTDKSETGRNNEKEKENKDTIQVQCEISTQTDPLVAIVDDLDVFEVV